MLLSAESGRIVVPKSKDDIRLALNLRSQQKKKTNFRASFRMLSLERIQGQLTGASWISTIDLTSTLFQIELQKQ